MFSLIDFLSKLIFLFPFYTLPLQAHSLSSLHNRFSSNPNHLPPQNPKPLTQLNLCQNTFPLPTHHCHALQSSNNAFFITQWILIIDLITNMLPISKSSSSPNFKSSPTQLIVTNNFFFDPQGNLNMRTIVHTTLTGTLPNQR